MVADYLLPLLVTSVGVLWLWIIANWLCRMFKWREFSGRSLIISVVVINLIVLIGNVLFPAIQ